VSGSEGADADVGWMRQALGLARRARGRTAPNPLVGSVIVAEGRRIAGGLHVRPGQPHAEVVALRKAGERARGATLYVNLEPCAHHGRTPPCVEAVLESGVRRVVVGMLDPDPRTAGRSVQRMRSAGLEVVVGVEEAACRALNRGFVSRLVRGRPFTMLKLAASWDGRVATATGDSRWITGVASREWVHRLRSEVDGIAVGSRTACIDDPALTARHRDRVVHRPRRIVVDSKLSVPSGALLFRRAAPGDPVREVGDSVCVLASSEASPERRQALEAVGARVVECAVREDHLDLEDAWGRLAELGVNDLLVEGGGQLGAALLRASLVDRLYLFLAPLLIGETGKPVLGDLGVSELSEAPRPQSWALDRVGSDLLLTAEW